MLRRSFAAKPEELRMQRIVPFLWFDRGAAMAAEFYAGIFPESSITSTSKTPDTPSGTVEIVSLKLYGLEFQFMSAGPMFKFTPAISFLVSCDSKEDVDGLWEKLKVDGKERMPLGEYPFSKRYGWIEDSYGISWQLMYWEARQGASRITPTLMFVGDNCGKAEEAAKFYASVFRDSALGQVNRYGPNMEPNAPELVSQLGFQLAGQGFAAMDSAFKHGFTFTEAISFMISCDSQDEVDHYWNALSAVPEAEQCGWLKDRYGLSWQVVPSVLAVLMQDKDPEFRSGVTSRMLKMKKLVISELKGE
jgi:predicted 3-demethylubiquinone-9 3-methyltransferase (glyoxalase superfamily)